MSARDGLGGWYTTFSVLLVVVVGKGLQMSARNGLGGW
jgi:hypothetical protein